MKQSFGTRPFDKLRTANSGLGTRAELASICLARKPPIWQGADQQRTGGRSADSRFPIPDSRLQKGFSLLEVIAAVLLLAITFATLMRVAGSSLNLTARAAERSEAAMWARSLLDSAYVLESPRVGASSGRFDTRYQWRLNVSPWQAPAAAAGPTPVPLAGPEALRLYRLDLEVLWTAAGHHYNAHFSTLRLATPQEQQPGAAP